MKILRSYIDGHWHEASDGFATLVNPSTEEPVARVSSAGVDFGAALAWAREHGGPALRAMSFAQRGELLKAMSGVLREGRNELLELSRINNGTTTRDGNFDIGGGSGTLGYYAGVARGLGDRSVLVDGDGVQLTRDESFWGQHVLVPRHGVAVFINAFNFPAWGFAEKAAAALLAGMPVITKPATSTALVGNIYAGIDTADGDADGIPDTILTDFVAGISIGENQTLQACYTVPNNYTALLSQFCTSNHDTAGNATATFRLRKSVAGAASRVQEILQIDEAQYQCTTHEPPIRFAEKTDIELTNVAGANNASVTGTFDLVLIAD